MIKNCLLGTLLFSLASVLQAAEFEIQESKDSHTDILRDGKPVLRYMHARDESSDTAKHNTYKVYHHVFDPSGKEPITKGPGGKYTHHRGLFLGFSKLRSHGKTSDLWHMKNSLQLHKKFARKKDTSDQAVLSSVIHWTIPEATLVEETRTVTVHEEEDSHLLVDFVSELKAVGSDATFSGDPEHAGMQYRPANRVAENKSAKYVFPSKDTNVREERDLPWAALTYRLGDAIYTVQHMNHPENPQGTRYSAYRDYGRFGAYPEFELEEGKTRALRYRIRVTLGEAPSRDKLKAEYQKFAEASSQ